MRRFTLTSPYDREYMALACLPIVCLLVCAYASSLAYDLHVKAMRPQPVEKRVKWVAERAVWDMGRER